MTSIVSISFFFFLYFYLALFVAIQMVQQLNKSNIEKESSCGVYQSWASMDKRKQRSILSCQKPFSWTWGFLLIFLICVAIAWTCFRRNLFICLTFIWFAQLTGRQTETAPSMVIIYMTGRWFYKNSLESNSS